MSAGRPAGVGPRRRAPPGADPPLTPPPPRPAVSFYGPMGQFKWEAGELSHVGMVAGGTGITPMFQVLQAALADRGDVTDFTLVYGNVTEEDILLRKALDQMAADHPNRLTVHYVLDRPPPGWEGGSGYVTRDMLQELLPKPGPGVKVLACGPPPMVKGVRSSLGDLGYPDEAVFEF